MTAPAAIAGLRKPPKRWTSSRVCPACGGRETKILNLNSGLYRCQVCDHEYAPPPRVCDDCGKNPAEAHSRVCAGCDAYRDHTGHW